MNAINALNSLAATAKKNKQNSSDRPTVAVPEVALDAFERLVEANAVLEVAESRKEVEATVVNEIMLDAFAETVFRLGTTPANPKLEVKLGDGRPDLAGIFQVQGRFKINVPETVNDDDNMEARFLYALREAGLTEEQARKLYENEIDANPIVSLRPFNELVNGHYEGEGKTRTFVEATEAEKAAGQKLLQFVLGQTADPLTDEEKDLVVRQEESIKVKANFLQRLKLYCENATQVKGILKVIQPVHYVSHMKFGISDTPEDRQHRLVAAAANVLGQAA
jgi:hypothetical protein